MTAKDAQKYAVPVRRELAGPDGARLRSALLFCEVGDSELIVRSTSGDLEAFNLIVLRWERHIFNYLLRLLTNREDASDISQEVFLKVYQNLPKLAAVEKFAAWLFCVARNQAFSFLRRKRPETVLPQDLRPAENWGRLLPLDQSLAVKSALKLLSDDQRDAVLLKVCQGFTFDEIAGILGCPASTVKSRVYTALELLKAALVPSGPSKVNDEQ